MGVSAIVTASQGCAHADAVLTALRAQAGVEDEILVLEPSACDGPRGDAGPHERHLLATSIDDFETRIQGLAVSDRPICLLLEDHGVPGPDLLDELARTFAANPATDVLTFFVRNGTSDDAASRALYAFVLGGADIEGDNAVPEVVASSMAISGPALASYRQRAREGTLLPGELEYTLAPTMGNNGLAVLSKQLVLTHYQRNSPADAMRAVYWNARHAGWLESDKELSRGRLAEIAMRYLGRSASIIARTRAGVAESTSVAVLGSVGMLGWWVGRWAGPGRAAVALRDAHPHAAEK